jgi:hypothetical protein
MQKVNCWDFRKCGEKSDGTSAGQPKPCDVAAEEKCDQINHGRNGGRVCWFIRQKRAERKDKGFAMMCCSQCDFYKMVEKEEGDNFFAYQ